MNHDADSEEGVETVKRDGKGGGGGLKASLTQFLLTMCVFIFFPKKRIMTSFNGARDNDSEKIFSWLASCMCDMTHSCA